MSQEGGSGLPGRTEAEYFTRRLCASRGGTDRSLSTSVFPIASCPASSSSITPNGGPIARNLPTRYGWSAGSVGSWVEMNRKGLKRRDVRERPDVCGRRRG